MSYLANTISELTITTPTEGTCYPPEVDDAIRELKRALKYQFTPVEITSAAYTALTTSSTILADATSNNITITLPTAVGIEGRIYVIKKIDTTAYTVTIDGDGSETIDGVTTYTIYHSGAMIILQSDGANWQIIFKSSFNSSTVKTADYTVTSGECRGRTTFTNEGASEAITFTLPTAAAGYRVSFIVLEAYNLIIAPGASDTITIGASEATTDIRSDTVGDSIELVAVNATQWIALNPGSTTFTVN